MTNYTNASAVNNALDWKDITLITTFVIIFITGVLGNALVCLFFRTNENRKVATMESLIFWLAVVDLAASVINPSLYIYWQVTSHKVWHFGKVACKIFPTLAKASVSVSIGIILVITIDRCIVICRPFSPSLKTIHVNIAMVIVVFLSIATEIPHIVYLTPMDGYSCVVPVSGKATFAYPVVVTYILRDMFFLSTFTLTAILICRQLFDKERINTLNQQKSLRRNKEVIIMLVTMAIVFIILVFPRDILHIVYLVSWLAFSTGLENTKTLRDINATLKVLHMCNSVCNVFIYAGFHSGFRRKLIRHLKTLPCFKVNGNLNDKQATIDSSTTSTDLQQAVIPMLLDVEIFNRLPETKM